MCDGHLGALALLLFVVSLGLLDISLYDFDLLNLGLVIVGGLKSSRLHFDLLGRRRLLGLDGLDSGGGDDGAVFIEERLDSIVFPTLLLLAAAGIIRPLE